MLSKNKALYIFSLLVFSNIEPQSLHPKTDESVSIIYSFSHVIHDLELRQKLSKSRLIILPTIIATTLYLNRHSISHSIADSPVPFLAASCFLCNYLIDTVSRYRKINQTLDFLIFSQTMSHYMLCALTIKNTMNQQKETKHINFSDEDFFRDIATQTGHSLEELEQLTLTLISSGLHSINNLCTDIKTTDLGENIYFLFKEKVSIGQMLVLSKNDKELCQALSKFYTNPEKEYPNMITTLCTLLRKHLRYFI